MSLKTVNWDCDFTVDGEKLDMAHFEVFDFIGVPYIDDETGEKKWTGPNLKIEDLEFTNPELGTMKLKDFPPDARRTLWEIIKRSNLGL